MNIDFIKYTPIEVLTDKDKYEIQHYHTYNDGDQEWLDIELELDKIIDVLTSPDYFRYRLKPLEPIRITKYIWSYLLKESNVPFRKEGDSYICVQSQRPVEIIDE